MRHVPFRHDDEVRDESKDAEELAPPAAGPGDANADDDQDEGDRSQDIGEEPIEDERRISERQHRCRIEELVAQTE